MLQVTNGTVERVYKPGDYESRRVSLSFNCDPGDDLETGLANLSALAEKHARQMPGTPVQGQKTKPAEAKQADPPIEPVRTVSPAPVAEPVPTPATTTNDAPSPAGPPTADDVVKAAQEAVKRLGAEKRHEVTAVVNKFVDEPNMPIRSTPEAKRADLIAALAELGKPAASADY